MTIIRNLRLKSHGTTGTKIPRLSVEIASSLVIFKQIVPTIANVLIAFSAEKTLMTRLSVQRNFVSNATRSVTRQQNASLAISTCAAHVEWQVICRLGVLKFGV